MTAPVSINHTLLVMSCCAALIQATLHSHSSPLYSSQHLSSPTAKYKHATYLEGPFADLTHISNFHTVPHQDM